MIHTPDSVRAAHEAAYIEKYLIDGEEPTKGNIVLLPDHPEELALSIEGAEEAAALHVTLKFLGDIPGLKERKRVEGEVQRIANEYAPVEFTIVRAEMFGRNLDVVSLVLQARMVGRLFAEVHAATPDVELKWPTYKPHMALWYIKPPSSLIGNVDGPRAPLSYLEGRTFTCGAIAVQWGTDVVPHRLLGVLKGDYPGHPFRGNQWTGRGFAFAPDHRMAGTAGPRTTKAKTGIGVIDRVPDSHYEMTLGNTTGQLKRAGVLDNPRSSISSAINPLTGHRMSNTEMGAVMEALITNELAGKEAFTSVLGSGMRHIVGRSSGATRGRDSRGAIDLATDTHALELKSISVLAGDPKVSIKGIELMDKARASKAMKKKGAVLVAVVREDSTVDVWAFVSPKGFIPTTADRLQIKRNSKGWQKLSHGEMVQLGTIRPTKRAWTRATKKAGWERDSNGKLIQRERIGRNVEKGAFDDDTSLPAEVEPARTGDLVIWLEGRTPRIGWEGGMEPPWVKEMEEW